MAYLVKIANQCLNLKHSFFGYYILVFTNLISAVWGYRGKPGI